MKFASVFVSLLLVSGAVGAKDKPMPLPEAAIPALNGKTLAVTRHAKPSFTAMTPGKAAFALVGAGAMIAAGNKLVKDHDIADPADILEEQIVPAMVQKYGMQLVPASARVIAEDNPAKIAAGQTNADYILDIRSGGWMFSYYPSSWDTFWMMYSGQIQLIDARSGKLVSKLACNAGTNKDPNSPTKDAMLGNGAQMLKDVMAGFGWTCARLLATEQFRLPADSVAQTPAEYVDVLARYAAARKAASQPQQAASE